MPSRKRDLLPGTLDMLILKAVSLQPLHGYGVLLRIGQISGGALEIHQPDRAFRRGRQRASLLEWILLSLVGALWLSVSAWIVIASAVRT
mgnify:CR=1 FL=1